MVWAPRCALLPLGSVRGEEGLNIWEHIAFADAAKNCYVSGDSDEEAEAEECFNFHEDLAAQEEADRLEWEDDCFTWDDDTDSQCEQEDDYARFED